MAKDLKVAKAFQSTVSKEDKTPQVVQTRGGEMHKFMVQFEGRNDWIGILKKPGNVVNAGDSLYGNIIEDGQWGKPEFKGEQKPFGEAPAPQASAPRAATTQPSGTVEEKLDYLISLVENFLESQGSAKRTSTTTDTVLEDVDDGPVDLSELPY